MMKIYTKDGYWKIDYMGVTIFEGEGFTDILHVKETMLRMMEHEFNKEIVRLIEIGTFNKYQ